jgi:hypothetical protein
MDINWYYFNAYIIGWAVMLTIVPYQLITGNLPNVHWELVADMMVSMSICGDSIILLIYDARWNSGLESLKRHFESFIK